MADPRAVLDVIRQRADNATDGPWMKDPDDPSIVLKPDKPGGWDGTVVARVQRDDYGLVEEGVTEFIAAARSDVPRLVAALTAALDLCDDPGGPDSWSHMFQGRQSVFVDDLRAVIEAALTEEGA